VSHLCIGDFLYGSNADSNDFKRKFTQINTFESIKTETSAFWLKLIEDFLFKAFSVTIIGKPCEKLMHTIGEEDKRRVEERRKALGKKGLNDVRTKVDNAVSENDVSQMSISDL
jgi:Zn-dependent M16 (insulinase) family peptidase